MSKLWRGRDDAGKQIPSPPGSSLRLELHFQNGGPSISGMNHTALEDKLGYRFNNPDLLVQALTHPSTDSKPETRRAYERLEFLGDAILQLAVTQYLYHHMPQSPEGELTQLRARTVSRANLGKYGFILGLDKHIALGKGEERAGGRSKNSIIANTFESVFGAMPWRPGRLRRRPLPPFSCWPRNRLQWRDHARKRGIQNGFRRLSALFLPFHRKEFRAGCPEG